MGGPLNQRPSFYKLIRCQCGVKAGSSTLVGYLSLNIPFFRQRHGVYMWIGDLGVLSLL